MIAQKMENDDNDSNNDVLKKNYKLDRFMSVMFGILIPFLFVQLWVFKDDFQKRAQDIEVRQAEIRGQMAMLLGQVQSLIDSGDQISKRTESAIKDSFDRLERRIERMEQQKGRLSDSAPPPSDWIEL